MSLKIEKVKSLISELASDFINRTAGPESLITVTKADLSADIKRSTIFVTIFPEKSEPFALNFLKRKRGEFRDFVKSKSKLRVIPTFDFEIDLGEKNRQQIDRISSGDN